MNRLILLIAQGLGTGLSPKAPGTIGTLLGIPLLVLLLLPKSLLFFVLMILATSIASVYFCTRAEIILKQRDPASVVIDEIIAVPACFSGWITAIYFSTGKMPDWSYFFSSENVMWSVGIVLLFRIFDIAKPWPIGQSQELPNGWGVTIDDLLAAVYVNVIMGLYVILF